MCSVLLGILFLPCHGVVVWDGRLALRAMGNGFLYIPLIRNSTLCGHPATSRKPTSILQLKKAKAMCTHFCISCSFPTILCEACNPTKISRAHSPPTSRNKPRLLQVPFTKRQASKTLEVANSRIHASPSSKPTTFAARISRLVPERCRF